MELYYFTAFAKKTLTAGSGGERERARALDGAAGGRGRYSAVEGGAHLLAHTPQHLLLLRRVAHQPAPARLGARIKPRVDGLILAPLHIQPNIMRTMYMLD